MTKDTTQQLGWAWEADAETDPIDAVDAKYWKFGIIPKTASFTHPSEEYDVNYQYDLSSAEATDESVIQSKVVGNVGYLPVNGAPWFMVMGNSSSVDGVHTLVPPAIGTSNPTFTVRSESTGGTTNKFTSAVGCKGVQVSTFLNRLGTVPILTETLGYMGISAGPSTSLNAVHTTGTTFPTDDYLMDGTISNTRYQFDANTVLTWNSNNIKSDVVMLKLDTICPTEPTYVENQVDAEYLDEGYRQHTISLSLWRGSAEAATLRTDYFANTARTLIFKIFAGATNYRQYTYTNCTLVSRQKPYFLGKQEPLVTYQIQARNLSLAVKDGVSDSFYKD